MDKQTTSAFILIGIILVVWLYMNAPEPGKLPPQNTQTDQQISDTLVAETKPVEKPVEVKEKLPVTQDEESSADNPFASENETGKIITIDTDLFKIEMNSMGARLRKVYLKEYETWYYTKFPEDDFYNRHVQLINPENGGDFNLVFVTKEGKLINTAAVNFTSDKFGYQYEVKGDESLELNYEYVADTGQKIKRTYTFWGNRYDIKSDVELFKMNEIISSYRYDVVWSHGINFVEGNSTDEATYSSALAYSGDEKLVIDASSTDETEKKDINGLVDWVGVKNKYFVVLINPENPSSEGGAYFVGTHTQDKIVGDREYYSASLKIPFKDTEYQKNSFNLYIGPLEYDRLKNYNKNYQEAVDFGSFMGLSFVIQPISEYVLLPLFTFLHLFIPNYGWVIIVFSIIIKLALWPLTKQSYLSMKKMQLLQPQIAPLKEKYKGEPQKLQRETMGLYKKYGVSPTGGCLPMVLQMPILFALFTFFRIAIQIRHEPFIGWITNLSSPDILFTLPFKIPLLGVDQITGLAPLLGITMFFQQAMTARDPNQKMLTYIMPFMFTFLFMSFPSGLNLYYFMFNLLSIIQQQLINRSSKGAMLEPVKNPKKGGGFMARLMDAAEQKQKAQRHGGKVKKQRKF